MEQLKHRIIAALDGCTPDQLKTILQFILGIKGSK